MITPFAHQREVLQRTQDLPGWALFWEQGCGKTKPMLDTAAYLHRQGKINGLLVVAPNGVHRNWVTDEVPRHWPSEIALQAHVYYSARSNSASARKNAAAALQTPGMALLAMTYDGFLTKAGRALAQRFLDSRSCLFVLDEAHRIKTPGAKRTKALLADAKRAPYRRVLTGTPVANSPFDVYTIMKFLNLDFWKPFYLDSYFIFKHHFGIFQKGLNRTQNREYEFVVGYRNLEQLEKILAGASDRVTKDQVLDLPPKLYSRRYLQLNPAQQRAYNDLRDEFMTFLGSELVTAPLAITRLLRLQQVTCGYLPAGDGQPLQDLSEHNPRLELLAEIVEDLAHPALIWARFSRDIDLIMELLGDRAVRYDGKVSDEDRARNKELFQSGEKQFFVCNLQINEGLTLTQARTVIYYNNSFKLTDRLQSEDRVHRPGQEHPVNYIDLVAEDTVDEYIVDRLIKKYDIASTVLGDELKGWLRA